MAGAVFLGSLAIISFLICAVGASSIISKLLCRELESSQTVTEGETMGGGMVSVNSTPEGAASVRSKWAKRSLIYSIIAMFPCLMFFSVVAVICGHVATNEINNSKGQKSGYGMAMTGLVLGYIELVLMLAAVILSRPK